MSDTPPLSTKDTAIVSAIMVAFFFTVVPLGMAVVVVWGKWMATVLVTTLRLVGVETPQ